MSGGSEGEIRYVIEFLRLASHMARRLHLDPIVPYLMGCAELEVTMALARELEPDRRDQAVEFAPN
jgi:hypothetical protein